MLNKLLTLDIDEGIRIESIKNKKKMYINKRTLECFVVEIINPNSMEMTDNKEIKFCNNVKDIYQLINSIFGREYSVIIY